MKVGTKNMAIEHHTHKTKEAEEDGEFYKGLFFGVLIGAGLIWLLGSDTGKELLKNARKRIDEAISGEAPEGLDEEVSEADTQQSQSEEIPGTEAERSDWNPPTRIFKRFRLD